MLCTEAEVDLFLREHGIRISAERMLAVVPIIQKARVAAKNVVRESTCAMPCADGKELSVQDIFLVHPPCDNPATRWIVSADAVHPVCNRCYASMVPEMTASILAGKTCVVGDLFTPAVQQRVSETKRRSEALAGRVRERQASLEAVLSEADGVCEALSGEEEEHVRSVVRGMFASRVRKWSTRVATAKRQAAAAAADANDAEASFRLSGGGSPECRAVPPHPLYTHITQAVQSTHAVKDDLTSLLRKVVAGKQHRMAGLLAAKLLLIQAPSPDVASSGRYLEEHTGMIKSMVEAARK